MKFKLTALTKIISLSAIGISPIAISAISNDSLKSVSVNLNNNISPKTSDEINSFSDYDILASSNNISPVITSIGMIGMSKDKKRITLTTYEGVLMWNLKIEENPYIKKYYSEKNITNFTDYKIHNYIYVPETNVLSILFGDNNNQNQVLFGIDYTTGLIYNPISVSTPILPVLDGITNLYLNSSNKIIGTSGMEFANYSIKTQMFVMNGSQGISQVTLPITESIGESEDDYLLYITKGTDNINFAVFMDKDITTNNGRKIYAIAVDDYLVAIKNGSSNKVSKDLGYFENITNPKSGKTSDINWDEVIRCKTEFTATWTQNNSKHLAAYFIISGKKSSIVKEDYNMESSQFNYERKYNFSEHKDSIDSVVYINKKLYVSNKRSEDGNAILRIFFEEGQTDQWLKGEVVERSKDRQYYDDSTKIYTKPIKIAPVVSQENLNVPDPFLVLKEGSDLNAKYIKDGITFSENISFKSFKSPIEEFKKKPSFKNSLPSSVNNNDLLNSLVFNNTFTGYTKTIKNRKNDDQNGTLYWEYEIAYDNWYDRTKKTRITIPVSVDGMYAKKDKFKFNFVTELNGDPTNDEKYKNVAELISSKYANQITRKDIIDYFLIYDIKDINGDKVTLTEDNIDLSIENSGYTLSVGVRLNNSNLPNGLRNTNLTYKYSGFNTVIGYEYSMKPEEDISSFKSEMYANELTLSILMNTFMDFGTKWDKNLENWDFEIISDNYDGVAYVTLIYKKDNVELPPGVNKKVLEKKLITGFKRIPEEFFANNAEIKMENYYGISTPSKLWESYLNDPKSSELFNSLSFPHISDNSNLDITINNEETMDVDMFLDLNISIKEGTETSFPVANTSSSGYFVFDSIARSEFQDYFGNNYPFNVKWYISKENKHFEWVPNEFAQYNQDQMYIDLKKGPINSINENMYADEVPEEEILKMFKIDGYDYEIIQNPNVEKGELKIELYLYGNSETKSSSNIKKTITISNFRIDTPKYVAFVPLIIIGTLSLLLVGIITMFSSYAIRKHKYKKMAKNIKK